MQWLASLLGGGIAKPIEAIGKIIDDVYTVGRGETVGGGASASH